MSSDGRLVAQCNTYTNEPYLVKRLIDATIFDKKSTATRVTKRWNAEPWNVRFKVAAVRIELEDVN